MDSKRRALVGLDLEVFIWLCNDYKEKAVVYTVWTVVMFCIFFCLFMLSSNFVDEVTNNSIPSTSKILYSYGPVVSLEFYA